MQSAGTWNRGKGWDGRHLRSRIYFERQRNGGRREEVFAVVCQTTFRSSVVGIADDWQVFQFTIEIQLIVLGIVDFSFFFVSGTFKLKKKDLQEDGFDIKKVNILF